MFKLIASVAIATVLAGSAQAATIDWANWSNPLATGTAGSATATLGGNIVTYSGELISFVDNYPSWGPPGTFNGGTVGNAPPSSGGIIQLYGGHTGVNTLTFESAVTNPVIAIWSLGQEGVECVFQLRYGFHHPKRWTIERISGSATHIAGFVRSWHRG